MAVASVFRVEKTKNYTVMSNHHLKNTRLSLKAKGLLSLMLSLPDNWDYTAKGLASICKDGIDSINATVKELEREGYVKRFRIRNAKGQLTTTEYVIYEEPQHENQEDPIMDRNEDNAANTDITSFEPKRENPVLDEINREKPKRENPILEKPILEKPILGKPILENPHQLNTNILSTKELNTNKSNTNPSFIHSTDVIDIGDKPADVPEGMKAYKKICDNVNFDSLLRSNPDKVKFILFVKSVISSVLQSDKPIKSKGQTIPKSKFVEEYLKLNGEMIISIADDLENCRSKIKDFFAYIASALYLAPLQEGIKREKRENDSSFDIDAYDRLASSYDLRKGVHDQWLLDNSLGDLVINNDEEVDNI